MHTDSKVSILCAIAAVTLLFVTPVHAKAKPKQVTVLTYHDIVTEPNGDFFAVTRSAFVSQMDFLQNNNYHVISLSELKIFEKYPDQMPDKSILLTFDDGLKSYAEFVAPLLEIYGFPSTASIVTGWLDGQDVPPEYHKKLMNWSTIQKLNKSPLVEFISHTHNLHQGVRANPQGSEEAAGITRRYLAQTQSYESEHQYRQRIHLDLKMSKTRLKEELGRYPNAIAWPYGLYDKIFALEARKLGMVYQLSLDDGPTVLSDLPKINRIMLLSNQSQIDFANELNYVPLSKIQNRIIELNLDAFIGKSLEEKERILSTYLDKHESIGANTLVVSPFSKNNDMAFFYNRQTKVATDILSRVLNGFRSKLDIRKVFLKLPSRLPYKDSSHTYEDLARLIKFDGVIFDANIDAKRAAKIRSTIDKYKPNIRYGVYGMKQNPFEKDFVVAPINLTESLRNTRKKLSKLQKKGETIYYLAVQNNNNTKQFFHKASQTFDFLNAKHFGYKLKDAFIKINSTKKHREHVAIKQSPATGG